MSVISSPKTQTADSKTWGSGLSDSPKGQALRRRRTKLPSDKKIADDEFMAAAIGDVEWLKQSLRDAGPDINFDKNGLTAIHLAAIHGRMECLKVCVEKFKIDINLPSTTGWRAVHLCISNQTGRRSLQCLAYLLEKGADHSIGNEDGITPVHQAASEGHVQCLKMLLEVGAKIDGKDCRDNTPLDLAKLWGHRKCARILAAEMWHQDKNDVAKEMHQLKKVKMQQVLKELEDDEEMKAAQQFYGDEAFKQWMAAKNLTESPTKDAEGAKGKQPPKESGYVPNSVRRKGESEPQKKPTKLKVSVDARKITEASNQQSQDELSDEQLLMALKGDDEAEEEQLRAPRNTGPVVHEKAWNKSTKTKDSDYVPNLNDAYPRDEYTIMPMVEGAPKFYEGKFAYPVTYDDIDEDVRTKGSLPKLRKPKLPRDIMNTVLAKDSSRIDRGMIFKCKHIGDVHAKKKYDVDTKGRAEAPLHLSDDVKSYMVKSSIQPALKRQTPKSTKSESSRFTSSEWMTDTYPLPMVMQTLKRLSKPTHFPNVNGREYLFNFGDVK